MLLSKVYNPIEMDETPGAAIKHEPFERYFVYVGRLTPSKGVSVLLRAFKQLHDCYPKCKLAIIGSGPQETKLKILAAQLGLSSNVFFLGHLPPKEVFLFLKTRGFATVVPSLWEEAFGRVVIESMTMGVPVIATKMGGMKELISDKETGLLVSPGDEDSLVDSMIELINKKEYYEQISAAALQNIKSFSVENIASKYGNLFRDNGAITLQC